MSDPAVHYARTVMARLEHLVVQDLFLTETAFHADVVLPASAFPEKDGTFTNTNRQVQMGGTPLPLPGETRQDWWIIQEIARRMGLNWNYSHPREVFAELAKIMPWMKDITWHRLLDVSSRSGGCPTPGRQTSCRTRAIRWCSRPGGCWSTGTPAP